MAGLLSKIGSALGKGLAAVGVVVAAFGVSEGVTSFIIDETSKRRCAFERNDYDEARRIFICYYQCNDGEVVSKERPLALGCDTSLFTQ